MSKDKEPTSVKLHPAVFDWLLATAARRDEHLSRFALDGIRIRCDGLEPITTAVFTSTDCPRCVRHTQTVVGVPAMDVTLTQEAFRSRYDDLTHQFVIGQLRSDEVMEPKEHPPIDALFPDSAAEGQVQFELSMKAIYIDDSRVGPVGVQIAYLAAFAKGLRDGEYLVFKGLGPQRAMRATTDAFGGITEFAVMPCVRAGGKGPTELEWSEKEADRE